MVLIGMARTVTIHALAQAGDVDGLQGLLEDNPLHINLRNSIMLQTPLHVAAAHNQIGVVNFLLNWKGQKVVDLEAMNMYGETALHLGAKNGCSEIVILLLKHNALKDARANNGMTPLHLAVWSSFRSGKLSTVEALLEFNADVNAKDNDALTPLNHLPHGQGSEDLRSLLLVCHEMQLKRQTKVLLRDSQRKWGEMEAELGNIIGLHELKVQLRRWAKGMLLDEQRRKLFLEIPTRRPPHMAFLGNPGTGKTLVARLLAKLLFTVGILSQNKVVEVQRTDLVGEFVGHTGPKTRKKLKEAEGGLLFVDEAYRLMPAHSEEKDFGVEALEEIMSVMDSGKVVIVFAGYPEPMKRVFSCNEGFRRRVTKYFHFEDYSIHEIAEIAYLKIMFAQEDSLMCGFKLDKACSIEAMAELLEKTTTEKQRKDLNGAIASQMLIAAREHLDERLSLECCDPKELMTLKLEDIEAGLRLIG